MNDFVVFILTHGRADNVITYRTLKKAGYTGRIVIVIDDEDKQRPQYIENFGAENVAIFSKDEEAKTFDEIIKGDRRTIVYARNACFGIAEKLGYRYFLELDDDYSFFCYNVDNQYKWVVRTMNCSNLNDVFSAILHYFKNTPTITSLALSQGGDFIGGAEHLKSISMTRKCMNSFFCDTQRPFKFQGRINEDVNTYTTLATRGVVFFTLMQFSLNQKTTQSNKGGMTDVYLDSGTYLKSFFTIITHPSGCKIALMGGKNKRLHHSIAWNNTAPKIINEKYKKYGEQKSKS